MSRKDLRDKYPFHSSPMDREELRARYPLPEQRSLSMGFRPPQAKRNTSYRVAVGLQWLAIIMAQLAIISVFYMAISGWWAGR